MPSVSCFYDHPEATIDEAWYSENIAVSGTDYYYVSTGWGKLIGKLGYDTVFTNLTGITISANIYHTFVVGDYGTLFGFSSQNDTYITTDEYSAYFNMRVYGGSYKISAVIRSGYTEVFSQDFTSAGNGWYVLKIYANSSHIIFTCNDDTVTEEYTLGDRTYNVKYFASSSGSHTKRIKNINILTPEIDSINTSINIFTPNNIDSATINLVSQVLKIFIDVAKSAVVVGQVIYENIIDITTTVIKIGQSTLTIIAQSATYIYSGLITIIDKVVVAINSFNALIDSIITTFETLYDEDTVYGSIIRVIPLILLLSIPTIVVYYKIGEFATIPMFMFMSIVAYMTSLMPLWILVVALIGCVAILIQKQRRSN